MLDTPFQNSGQQQHLLWPGLGKASPLTPLDFSGLWSPGLSLLPPFCYVVS